MNNRVARITRGVGLVELLISLTILSFVLFSVAALFFALFAAGDKNLSTTSARTVAESYLEELISTGSYRPTPADDYVDFHTQDSQSRTRFFRRVKVTPLAENPSLTYTGGYYLEVEVWWDSEAPEQSRAGRGRSSTKVGRFHYPDGEVVP